MGWGKRIWDGRGRGRGGMQDAQSGARDGEWDGDGGTGCVAQDGEWDGDVRL